VTTVVLLVAVSPQVASAVGLGTQGTVQGAVAVSGAPAGFVPGYLGAGACPATPPPTQVCPDPVYALAAGGSYSLPLSAGTWDVEGFYEITALGGAFLGHPHTVTVPAGGTVLRNLRVPYEAPAELKGTIQVAGVPTQDPVQQITVLLCPTYAPYDGTNQSIACVSGFGQTTATGGSFDVTGLPPGGWIAYPGFCTAFGCSTNARAGVTVTLSAGGTADVALSTPFVLPGEALLIGTVSVTGAPVGFADQAAVWACSTTPGDCEEFGVAADGAYALLLGKGTWHVTGLYLVPPYDNAVAGQTQNVPLKSGQTDTLDLSVPYQQLGTAAGTIDVTGVPAGVTIKSYTVSACPVGTELLPTCVTEYSGPGGESYGATEARLLGPAAVRAASSLRATRAPFNVYSLPTLTPGQWILSAGYQTAFGLFSQATGTTVTVTANGTTTGPLTVPYQTPSVGVVSGVVAVVDAPEGGLQSGAQACAAPPTGSSCLDAQQAYSGPNGHYLLSLTPGTWWVAGFADILGVGPGQSEVTTHARTVTVAAGGRSSEDFTVKIPA
jgi:hypothetical protein